MLFEWVFYRFLHLCCYSVWMNAIVLVLCHLVDWRLFSWCLLLLSNCLAVCLLCYFLCCLVGVCYFLCCVAKYAGWMCASSLCAILLAATSFLGCAATYLLFGWMCCCCWLPHLRWTWTRPQTAKFDLWTPSFTAVASSAVSLESEDNLKC